VCCSVLQCVAVWCSELSRYIMAKSCTCRVSVLQYFAVCCSLLHCVAVVWCSVLQCVAVYCSVCCSVLLWYIMAELCKRVAV